MKHVSIGIQYAGLSLNVARTEAGDLGLPYQPDLV